MNQPNDKIPCARQRHPDRILEVEMLQTKFDNFPKELQRHDQWVVWKGKKIPYDPTRPNSKAKVIDPYSWGSFTQADTAYSEGGWLGVGFVLTGNGIAGVDLDKCVVDGQPSKEALQLLAVLDAAYIEYSLSGNGLRAFGFANQSISGVRGQLDDWLRAKVNAGTKK
jgi:putative DNA primase/helicase